ncbi:MAG TPA: right-handed parallel beta-helix repeat-containing protein, partial [Candidatus Hydrogenedentes bacterium]|nr:right-handed parallel beta-helix repeat-containing protein [Candidatus Hydrogenedentota bacterium]
VSFAADSRELDRIPAYPSTPYQMNASSISSLGDAKNMLYLLNAEPFGGRTAYLNAIDATNYDVFIIDLFYDETALSTPEVTQLKSKANGGQRLLLAYMSIGEAEDYRYYWQSSWHPGTPGWLEEENPDWEGNYKVRYWDPGWQAIIFGSANAYLDRILAAGFDGVYLDIIDAYEYFEEYYGEGEEEGQEEGEGLIEGENEGEGEGILFFVDTNAPMASDLNPGTENEPWKTIQKAADALEPGETVYIKAGVYHERIEPQNSGTLNNFISYSAYPGDEVTIDGTGVAIPEWAGLFDILGQDYIRVSGLRIINAISDPHNPGIQADSSSHIIIENNYVNNTNDSGIGVWSCNDVCIDHNEVEGCCQALFNECISVGGTDTFETRNNHVHHSPKEGIDSKDGSCNGKVYGNYVHHTEGVGIYTEAWDKHTHTIEVFANIVHDVEGDGITLASEQGGLLENIRVYNNIAYHNAWTGLDVSQCCSDTHPLQNLYIVNNTFYNNGIGEWGGGIFLDNPQASGVVIRNNICSQNLSFQIAVVEDAPISNYVIDHNLIDGFRGEEPGETRGTEYQEGSAGFVNVAASDFHLTGTSPAIDHGAAANAPGTDLDGTVRPHGSGYDIGAFEY